MYFSIVADSSKKIVVEKSIAIILLIAVCYG